MSGLSLVGRAEATLCCGARDSVVVARGLSICGSQALELRLSSCGAQA